MKKRLCVWLALLLTISLTACGGGGKDSGDVQTETPDLLDISRSASDVGGNAQNSDDMEDILSDIEERLAKNWEFTELPDAEWSGIPSPEGDAETVDGEESGSVPDGGQSAEASESVTEAPAPQTPEPVTQTPAPQTPEPVTQTPAPQTPEPVAETPAPRTPEPVEEAPAPQTPEPVEEAPVPQAPPEPVEEAPVPQAPPEPVEEIPPTQTPPQPVEETPEPVTQTPEPVEETPEPEPVRPAEVTESGAYTTKEDVSLYLHRYGRLPRNFITKEEARELGWDGGSLEPYASGMCIGGDYFGNYEKLLPEGRSYHECDIDTLGANSRGAKRLVYSDDGLIYYTPDHYNTFILLYGQN